MSASAVLVITALILFSFTAFIVHTTGLKKQVFTRWLPDEVPNVFIIATHPYEWALTPLATVALILFAAGLILKLYDAVF